MKAVFTGARRGRKEIRELGLLRDLCGLLLNKPVSFCFRENGWRLFLCGLRFKGSVQIE